MGRELARVVDGSGAAYLLTEGFWLASGVFAAGAQVNLIRARLPDTTRRTHQYGVSP